MTLGAFLITQDELKILVNYDPDTGVFTARHDWRKMKRGDVLGWKGNGYLSISLKSKTYYLHRLAFLYMTGDIPRYVDHINGDQMDNRWSNLRGCSNQQNVANQKVVRSIHGLKGVVKNRNRFSATIMFQYEKIHLGTYDTPEEAHEAYMKKARELYGEFANAGTVHRVPKRRGFSKTKAHKHPTDLVEC